MLSISTVTLHSIIHGLGRRNVATQEIPRLLKDEQDLRPVSSSQHLIRYQQRRGVVGDEFWCYLDQPEHNGHSMHCRFQSLVGKVMTSLKFFCMIKLDPKEPV